MLTLGEISLSKEHCDVCTESTPSGESAIDGATSNKDIVDSPTSLLPQEVRLLYNVYSDIAVYSKHTSMTYWHKHRTKVS